MRFRRLLRLTSKESNEATSRQLSPSETVARYLLDKGAFSRENARVKPRALEPAKGDQKTSVFRTYDLAEEEIWSIGDRHVAIPQSKMLLGRAELLVRDIQSVGLDLEPDDKPPRHASIIGWPIEKNEWKSLSQVLAALAVLRVREGTSTG